MARTQLHIVLHQLHRLAEATHAEALSDRELLRRFAEARDEGAFAALMRRHGPLVLGVCQRALHNAEDAEDVFQATFLILARKARSTRWQNSIASWLCTVAAHLAARTRRQQNRRREQERQAGQMARPKIDRAEACRELASVLDEEMQRLPRTYREPLLLCYLEGLTRDQAARQLGWSLRTLERRLSQGRERLRQRLSQRGVSLPAALLTAMLVAESGQASVSTELLAGTIRAAVAFAGGGARTCASAVMLAESGLRSMAAAKMKLGVLVVLAASVLAGGAGGLARQAFVGEPPQAAQRSPQPQAPRDDRKRKDEPQVRVDRYGDPLPPGALARLGTLRFRHEGEANALAFSPDGKILAGLCNGDIVLWDAATGRELRRLKVMARGLDTRPFDFSPDGKTLAVIETVKTIIFFEAASGKKLRTLPMPSGFGFVVTPILRFAPDGKSLAVTVGVDKVAVVDAQSGKVIHTMGGHRAGISGFAFAPDGKTLAMATLNPSLQLWDVESGKLRRGIEQKPKDTFAHKVAFSPDGKLVAAGWWDRIGIYETATGKETARLEAKMQSTNGLAFTPDGKMLVAAGQNGSVHVWDVAEKKLRRTLGGQGVSRGMALSPDGKTAALASTLSAIRLWDISSGEELFTRFGGHNAHIHAVAFSPDGQTLFSGGDNQQIRLWRAKDWRQTRLFQGSARSLSVSPDGKRLASVYHKTIRVWDAASGEDVYQLKLPDTETIHGAYFAAGGEVLVSLDDTRLPREQPKDQYRTRLTVWDIAADRPRRSLKLPSSPYSFAVAPDGRTAFMGTIEQTIAVCDLDRGEMYRELRGFQHNVDTVAVSPDSRLLLSGSYDRSVGLWEVDSGSRVLSFASHSRGVIAVAFSADGRVAASADGNGFVPIYPGTGPRQIRLWDVATGKELGRLQGHETDVSALAFSPDGRRLVSTMGDSTILVWDVAFLADAVRHKPHDLDRAELERAWKDLADADAARACRAVGTLSDAPRQAVPFLKEHLRPVAPLDAEQVRQWIAELDSDDFKVREAAFKALVQADRQVEPALRRTLADKPSLEMRRRIEDLRRQLLKNPSAETLRSLRAIAVLEHIGTPEARQVLQAMARGAPARETQAAESAFRRGR